MRYRLLDTLRGFSLVSMFLYHICWDLVHMYGFDWPWFIKTQGYLWQQSICWLFIFVSGFCLGLKRDEHTLSSSCKRGLTIMASGLLVTAATLVFAPESKIIFGVLFFLGFLRRTVLSGFFHHADCLAGPAVPKNSGKSGAVLQHYPAFHFSQHQ